MIKTVVNEYNQKDLGFMVKALSEYLDMLEKDKYSSENELDSVKVLLGKVYLEYTHTQG